MAPRKSAAGKGGLAVGERPTGVVGRGCGPEQSLGGRCPVGVSSVEGRRSFLREYLDYPHPRFLTLSLISLPLLYHPTREPFPRVISKPLSSSSKPQFPSAPNARKAA